MDKNQSYSKSLCEHTNFPETETQSYWEAKFKQIFHLPETFACFTVSRLLGVAG